ncbi:MAG: type II toxin-antitoxin system death-on-curing family toxin [Planctomycetes bacterium]|nr:type II toxin-antitoxin system death-on-curing family toxin [Planctomycetota bacterium]MBZ0154427.1 type II toxin-antitoxin system death-on-curing family toxin [Planctomycetota bacterium]MCC7396562.1 type II toxin-antitoxin system death-on-curing family toxin [Planctomycetota bacterium]
MKAPIWLSRAAVLAMHADSVRLFGGSDGLRDPGLLESALARPQHLFAYEKPDLCRLAAAYGHGIAKNHPFVDGNKRAAFLATTVFLERNGLTFQAPPAHAVTFLLGLADGTLEEEAFAAWLRDNCVARRRGPKRSTKRRGRK